MVAHTTGFENHLALVAEAGFLLEHRLGRQNEEAPWGLASNESLAGAEFAVEFRTLGSPLFANPTALVHQATLYGIWCDYTN